MQMLELKGNGILGNVTEGKWMYWNCEVMENKGNINECPYYQYIDYMWTVSILPILAINTAISLTTLSC
jgi:hypothetical protein